jgi:threonine aldolase
MFTLSKGLGAPVGSMLLGSKDFITEARVWRKRLGGGMRQIGILAAAGLIALEEGPKRLHEDHENARRLADGVAEINGISIDLESVQTNIVIFDISGTGKMSGELCSKLREAGVLAIGISDKQIRMVTHLDVSRANVATTVDVITTLLR